MATDPTAAPTRRLTIAAIAFAVGYGVHGVDHLRRGMAASPTAIMIGGLVQGVFVVVAVALALRHHRRAPEFAIGVGFGSAALFAYAHLLPTFLPALQDSFVTGPRINVTWFSWVSALAEIGTALVFGYAGMQSLRVRPEAGLHQSTI